MVNLVIDIGNTLTKVALFSGHDLIEIHAFAGSGKEDIQNLLKIRRIDHAIISSVKEDPEDYLEIFEGKVKLLRFSAEHSWWIDNQYKTPSTLGLDRLAAIIGAAALYPESNCLCIDAGTCITYDFIDSERRYFGGVIAPGLQMRLKSMNAFTERLPLVPIDKEFDSEYGSDTTEAILAGAMTGTYYEMSGFINSYKTRFPDLKVLLCGGDANFFVSRLKNSIFAHIVEPEPNLVLIGLNEVIHQYNDKNF
jgi:type III pantothenate kinase